MTKAPDHDPRGPRAIWLLVMLGLAMGPRPARGEAGLSEAARARAVWLKRPYALVYSGDRQLGSDHVHLVRARDARWNDLLAPGGVLVPEEAVAGLLSDDVGPFAVVGSWFVFRFNASAAYGVLDMDSPGAGIERCSRADLIAKFGAVPDFIDSEAYHAAHWSWPTPGNALGQLLFLAGALVFLLITLVVIPFSIAWLILRVLRFLAPWAFVPLPPLIPRRRRPRPAAGAEPVR
ncbi:hypothetical protein [Paludisphaera sp.]|uniref:hypothetical protein n=1 Tax=Paludisphaera sp. TaxID=2017432 RepID=UPI00301D6588